MTKTKDMHFQEEELQEIGEYVRSRLPEWLLQRDVELRESQVRLETELKGQRELLHRHMDQSEKRFNEMMQNMEKRFEQVDKRFEEMLHYTDKRFESVEKRLISLETSLRRFIYSSFSFTAAAAGVIIAVLKLS